LFDGDPELFGSYLTAVPEPFDVNSGFAGLVINYSAVHQAKSLSTTTTAEGTSINELQRVIMKAESETMTNNNERQYKRHKRQNELQITFKNDRTCSSVLVTVFEFKKIHRILKFAQSPRLREYVELNTNFRTNAKYDFEKIYTNL